MIDEPPAPADAAQSVDENGATATAPAVEQQADGRVVIDLTRFVPPPPAEECIADDPDPINPSITVCETTGPFPRLGPMVGPVDDGFGSAIPRARIKLSDTASAEANVQNSPVGGFNANGGEVRLKIDF